MLTLHPTATRQGRGFKPMITIRRANGTMFGSRTSSTLWYLTREAATQYAIFAAECVAREMPEAVRVAA